MVVGFPVNEKLNQQVILLNMEKDDHLKKIDILEGELAGSKKSQGDLNGELEQMKKLVRMLSC